jgi:hypothetical protein
MLIRSPARAFGTLCALTTVLTAVLAACDRTPGAAAADSAAAANAGTPRINQIETTVSSIGWDMAAGSFVVLPTADGGLVAGSLLRPDTTESTVGDTTGFGSTLGDGRLELFGRQGKVGEAHVTIEPVVAQSPRCTAWPVARLTPRAGSAITPWTAAFAAGRITPLPLDSIEGLAPRDSARLAATLTRLASTLPDDAPSTFRGLRYVVLRAWSTRAPTGAFLVATLIRRVNQEDAPREERLVLVVDTPNQDQTTWRVGWHERAAGREEELVVAEPLLAFTTRDSDGPQLLFGRDDGEALSAALLTRRSGQWVVQWESAAAGCR